MRATRFTKGLKSHLFIGSLFSFFSLAMPAFSQADTIKFDYDGDRKADFAVRRPQTFYQYIRNSEDETTQGLIFGKRDNDIPISGDFDGDGIYDIAIRRASNQTWYIKNSSGTDAITGFNDGITRLRFGAQMADIPVPADYDGDGKTDIAVRRPETQTWYIKNSSGVDPLTGHSDGISRVQFGSQASDIPVPADYDGDGKADVAVRRPATQMWYIKNTSGVDSITENSDGITRKDFGLQANDIAIPADYDGDGKADLAVRRPSTQQWFILNSSGIDPISGHNDSVSRVTFGRSELDIPVIADYDGDGRADIAVRRPSTQYWYVLNSSGKDNQSNFHDGITRVKFGSNETDIPLAMPSYTIWNASDIDNDGLTNAQESALGTAIDNSDSDSDGLTDGEEINVYNTDPLNSDSDQDGVDDGEEVNLGMNPNTVDDLTVEFTDIFVKGLSGALGYGDRLRDGYLPNSLNAYQFTDVGNGVLYQNNTSGRSTKTTFNWQVEGADLLTLSYALTSEQLSSCSSIYRLDEYFDTDMTALLKDACWYQNLDMGQITYSYGTSSEAWQLKSGNQNAFQIERQTIFTYKLEIPQEVIDQIGSEWIWGSSFVLEVPSMTYNREFIYNPLDTQTDLLLSELNGSWALPLFYQPELGNEEYRILTEENFMIDTVEFSDDQATSLMANTVYTVTYNDNSFTLSHDDETLIFEPIMQEDLSYLVQVKRYVENDLAHIYVSKMVKDLSNSSYSEVTPETALPYVYAKTSNLFLDELLEDNQIPLNDLNAEQFRANGEMRGFIHYQQSYDSPEPDFMFSEGSTWQKNQQTNQISFGFELSWYGYHEYWKILNITESGMISILYYSTMAFDEDNDDQITEPERVIQLAPRIFTYEIIDLSIYGEAWLQSDMDEDGLTVEQEIEYGTSIDLTDTDSDGYSDGEEIIGLSDPLNADSLPLLANQVEFSDDNLKACLSGLMDIVTEVSGFDCSSQNITSLEGIEQFSNLTWLILSDNEISDLSPLQGLEQLRALIVNDNLINDISVLTEFPELATFYAVNNQISDITPLKNLNMRDIDLNNNLIVDISPLANHLDIFTLSIKNNNLNSVSSLSSIGDLTYLYIAGNNDIPCEDIYLLERTFRSIHIDRTDSCPTGEPVNYSLIVDPNLQACIENTNKDEIIDIRELQCNDMNIADISGIEQLFKLLTLELNDNQISDVSPVLTMSELYNLHIENNLVSDLSVFAVEKRFTELNLSGNGITDITPLSFSNITNNLQLNNNQIQDISALANLKSINKLGLNNNLISDISVLSELESLNNLSASNNNIQDISVLSELGEKRELWRINLSENSISDVSPLANFEWIGEINLSGNRIEDLSPFAGAVLPSVLYLDNNLITDLSPIGHNGWFETLGLSNNHISDLSPLSEMRYLEYLSLSGNQISNLQPLPKEANFETLLLANNRIENPGHVGRYDSLKRLDLENNQITQLNGFANLYYLDYLNLGQNQIQNLSTLQAKRLTQLYLHDNQLESIEHLNDFDKLEILDLSENNSLSCSSLDALQAELASTTITLPQECIN